MFKSLVKRIFLPQKIPKMSDLILAHQSKIQPVIVNPALKIGPQPKHIPTSLYEEVPSPPRLVIIPLRRCSRLSILLLLHLP